MRIVRQERFCRRDRYVVSFLAEDGVTAVGVPVIVDPVVTAIKEEGYTYYLLRSTDGVPDDRFYDYMNIKIENKPIKTRMATAAALRRFYCFLEIYHVRMDALTETDWNMLECFLLGEGFAPESFRADLSERSVQTANLYLVAIQRFLRAEGIHYAFLEEETPCSRWVDFHGVRLGYSFVKRVRSLKAPAHDDDWVPMYVSPGQFKALLEVVDRRGDATGRILVKLMYFYGLRLGECLGLTQEDVVMLNSLPGDGAPVPMLRLRNRISDAPFQRAKNLPTMTRDSCRNLGPRTYVLLTSEFYGELQEYVQSAFEHWYTVCLDRMSQPEASVLTDTFDQDVNHYLFRNAYGAPLTDAAWNARLRRYFAEAGIRVDSGRRQANLSHRLRHGCAMLLFRYLPEDLRLTEEQLRRFLRHKRLESTRIYSRPTVFDEYIMLDDFHRNMADALPFINDGYEALELQRRERLAAVGVSAALAGSLDADPDLDDLGADIHDDLD